MSLYIKNFFTIKEFYFQFLTDWRNVAMCMTSKNFWSYLFNLNIDLFCINSIKDIYNTLLNKLLIFTWIENCGKYPDSAKKCQENLLYYTETTKRVENSLNALKKSKLDKIMKEWISCALKNIKWYKIKKDLILKITLI